MPALLAAMRERLSDTAARDLHRGATSQDVVDTAIMLVAKRALEALLADLEAAAAAAAGLAREHRGEVGAGRTLLQQAAPITFGLRAAGWLVGLDAAAAELERVLTAPRRGLPEGEPLLLLGSLGSDLSMWDPQLPGLADRRTIRADFRGHGASPVPTVPYSVADLGADVLALMDALAIERVSLCGLSLGGMTAIWLAANAPERVGLLLLLCTSARVDSPRDYGRRAEVVLAEGTGSVAEAVFGRWLTPDFAAADPALVDRLRAMVAATPACGYAGCCKAIEAMDLRGELGSIAAPTLVVSATGDEALPPAHGREITAAVTARSSSRSTAPTSPMSRIPTA